MKSKKISDERIITQKRVIQSEAFSVLIYILVFSTLVQQFLLKAPFSQFAVEFFSLIAMVVYVSIRHLSMGLDITSSESKNPKKLLFSSVFSGFLSALFLMIMAGERNVITLLALFIMVTASFLGGNLLFQGLVEKKNKEIDDKLQEED